jgi:thymidine phosphorylase
MKYIIRDRLTDAQCGAVLPLIAAGAIQIEDDEVRNSVSTAAHQIRSQIRLIDSVLNNDSEDSQQAFLTNNLSDWLTRTRWDPIAQASVGYWLMGVYIRGLSFFDTMRLTTFLIGDTSEKLKTDPQIRTVRRYPTGGISEKQALILPVMIRACASNAMWSSPFLVARRLAHTGGTRDKLCVLPGMSFFSLETFSTWDREAYPVRYFTADANLCPRDAELYRLRGETGTVSEPGLMASSIMSKQIALPAEAVILDVLYGNTAFLQSRQQAYEFAELCQKIGRAFGMRVTCVPREANKALGNSIGNVTELLETIELLSPDSTHAITNWRGTDVDVSVDFICRFSEMIGSDADLMKTVCMEKLIKGELLQGLFELWQEHGVDSVFLDVVSRDARSALMNGFENAEIRSLSEGRLPIWDDVEISDFVNNELNVYGDEDNLVPARGGIEFTAAAGHRVSKGDLICRVYAEHINSRWLEALDKLVQPRS